MTFPLSPTRDVPVRIYSKRAGADPPPPDAEYCGRPSRYGNPFRVGHDGTHADVVQLHARWIAGDEDLIARVGREPPTAEEIRRDLAGKDLVCWCVPEPCHCTLLAAIANPSSEP